MVYFNYYGSEKESWKGKARHPRMKRRGLFLGTIVLAVGWAATYSAGQSRPSYIGAGKCKSCHLKKEYKAWCETKHATAFSRLKDNEAKDPKCVKCHVTGYGKGGYVIGGKNNPDLANVQCEACHGPGSEYKSITKDLAKEMAAGLILSDVRVCVECHNKESPHYKEFDFEKTKIKSSHLVPKG